MPASTRRTAAPVLALLSLLLLPACASDATEPALTAGAALPNAAELGAAFEAALDGSGVPGGAVILSGAGGAESVAVFGEASPGKPVTEETRFAYRSITKSFVGTVILQLVAEGRLELDAPVTEYLDGVPDGDTITVAELGTMRSGLANYSALPEMGEALSADPAREPAPAELLRIAFAAPADFEAGTAYEYSNTNTLLLGEIIAAVTGEDWSTAVAGRILEPLGLASVGVGSGTGQADVRGFQLADGTAAEELPLVAPGWFGAAGALSGDIRDLAAWGRALGAGALLDEPAQTQRLALLRSTADDPASPEYDRYGFAIGEISGWIGHTGNGLGFQSLVMYDPESERTLGILINATGENPDLPADVFQELIAEL